MKSGKIILFVLAAFALVFSFLFFLGAGGQTGSATYIMIAVILAAVGFVLNLFRDTHAAR